MMGEKRGTQSLQSITELGLDLGDFFTSKEVRNLLKNIPDSFVGFWIMRACKHNGVGLKSFIACLKLEFEDGAIKFNLVVNINEEKVHFLIDYRSKDETKESLQQKEKDFTKKFIAMLLKSAVCEENSNAAEEEAA